MRLRSTCRASTVNFSLLQELNPLLLESLTRRRREQQDLAGMETEPNREDSATDVLSRSPRNSLSISSLCMPLSIRTRNSRYLVVPTCRGFQPAPPYTPQLCSNIHGRRRDKNQFNQPSTRPRNDSRFQLVHLCFPPFLLHSSLFELCVIFVSFVSFFLRERAKARGIPPHG